MSEKSAKSFLSLLQRSGIVPEDRLKVVLGDLSKKAAGRTISLEELRTHLIEAGVITEWQSQKMLNGKYKGFFLGKYKLLGHLGSGGMSSVYLGEHTITGHKRALKVLPRKKVEDKSYFDRFYLEGRAAASLNDSNVVRVYDICGEGDTHYMVMEFVEGKDLFEMVRDGGPLEYELALEYITQAAKGLQHAHTKKLVHRDVKPANLLVTSEGTLKILDLGLALLTEDEESLTVLHNEKVMGTADYLAPEQAVNSHEVDHRADIYGLGCTLYFLLTGHPPFPKGSLAQRIAMHQTQEPAEITVDRPDCPPEIVRLCKRMMKKSANERFQSCRDVADAIAEIRESVAASDTITTGGSELANTTLAPAATNPSDVVASSERLAVAAAAEPSVQSSAEIRTDEIASDTLDIQGTPANRGSSGFPSLSDTEAVLAAKPARIKTRQSSKKSQQQAVLWFAVIIGLMFVLLITAVVVAMQFAKLDLPGKSDQVPGLVQSLHDFNSEQYT
jgi:serine/threonine-protein kinase